MVLDILFCELFRPNGTHCQKIFPGRVILSAEASISATERQEVSLHTYYGMVPYHTILLYYLSWSGLFISMYIDVKNTYFENYLTLDG